MRAFLALALLFALLAVALGDVCLGTPTLPPLGSNCGLSGSSAIPCRKGGFCSYKGVCTALIKVGGNCSNPLDTCVPDAVCRGLPGSKVCVSVAGPGETCSTNATTNDPSCSGSLTCSSGKCTGAYPGDTCTTNADCAITNCTNGLCAFVADGQPCNFNNQRCGPQSYCNSADIFNPVCAPLPTSGNCSNINTCAYGYSCVFPNPTDSVRQCVPWSSLAEGGFCSGVSLLCKSGVCFNSYCATNPPERCSSDSQCGVDRVCKCGWDHIQGGLGYCASASCTQEQKDFTACVNTNCKSAATGKGLCATLNCASQYTKLDSCSSASGLFASFTFVSLAVLFISFFSRQL